MKLESLYAENITTMNEGWREAVAGLGMIGAVHANATTPNLPPEKTPTNLSRSQHNTSDERLLRALYIQESSAGQNKRDGDNGRAIGPYQIWKQYWHDAVEFDPSIGGTYQDCRNKEYAEKIIRAYWRRYCPNAYKAGNYEAMARTHNGGPSGAKSRRTDGYWNEVKQILQTL